MALSIRKKRRVLKNKKTPFIYTENKEIKIGCCQCDACGSKTQEASTNEAEK